MAEFEFDNLEKKYERFSIPVISIEVAGQEIEENKYGLAVSDIRVELSAGFEASLATFVIYNVYDRVNGCFLFDRVKKYVLLGSSVVIFMGYGEKVSEVFRGFIAKVNFIYDEQDVPGIMVTAMDMKGIMMTNCSAKQLTAKTYSGALKEILEGEPYSTMLSDGVIKGHKISDTPDCQGASQGGGQQAGGAGGAEGADASQQTADTYTVEMVGESDYEFFVRTAKRFNYDFYIIGGILYFREAKSEPGVYMELGTNDGLRSINVEYDITGLYGQVVVRNVDPGNGKLITSSKQNKNKISQGSKAKSLISNIEKVYIDPTAASKDDASYRANYLSENMSYRFGTLEADMIGLPEMIPGRFIQLKGLGTNVENMFYVQEVIHTFSGTGELKTRIIGKAATITEAQDSGGGMGGIGGMSAMGGGMGGFM